MGPLLQSEQNWQERKTETSQTSKRMLLILLLSTIALSAAQDNETISNVEKAEEKLKELAKPSTLDLK